MIIIMLAPIATTLNAHEFVYSPIRSRRLINSKMKIRTTGSHIRWRPAKTEES